jgi:hypothetical protein
MWPDNVNWQMTVLFLLALALLGFAMKLVALLLPTTSQIQRHGISWVLVSPDSVLRSQPAAGARPILLRILILFSAVLLSYWVYWQLVRGFQVRGIFLSYLAVPILLLAGEFLVAVETLFFLPGGLLLPALHRRPWAARSIADFWGNRWNLWFSDWFRYCIFSRLRRRTLFALFLVFAISGLMHEWVTNFTLYHVTGRALFGSMMLYFLLQAAGILAERRFLKGHPRLMTVFVWLVVVVPVPLVLNEGLLRVLHLWPA